MVTEDLVAGGGDIAVTDDNKHDYVDKMVQWRLCDKIRDQMRSLVQGISDVFDPGHLEMFSEEELEMMIGGSGTINIRDWRDNTEYKNYESNDRVILWFWRSVLSFSEERRSKLLSFVTGTSRLPINGFSVSISCM